MRFIIFALLFCTVSLAEDSVDALNSKYRDMEVSGLKRLHLMHKTDLMKVMDTAMAVKNLDLANKTKSKIDELDKKILMLGGDSSTSSPISTNKFPRNEFYKLTSYNGKRASEKGKEILCTFERVSSERLDGTLTLVITGDGAYAHTNNVIKVLNGSKGKEIGTRNGLKSRQTVKIPLALSNSDEINLSIVNYGGDAFRLKPVEGTEIPNIYLIVE